VVWWGSPLRLGVPLSLGGGGGVWGGCPLVWGSAAVGVVVSACRGRRGGGGGGLIRLSVRGGGGVGR